MSNVLLTDQETFPPIPWNRYQNQELLSEKYYPSVFAACFLPPAPCSPTIDPRDSSSISNITAEELSIQSSKLLAGLIELTHLGADWDSYGSPAPTTDFVNGVIRLLSQANLLEIPDIQAFPVSGGGIQLEWSYKNQEVELTFFPDDTESFLITTGSGEVIREGSFTLALAVPILRSIGLRSSF